jgi:hypothetical protein
MRKKRCLTQDVWYEVRTAINNREPLFQQRQAVKVFCQVFGEARGLGISTDTVIKEIAGF